VDIRAVLDAVVKRKIHSPRRESSPTIAIVQLIAQLYTTELSRFLPLQESGLKFFILFS
jgi:hypothetical protein